MHSDALTISRPVFCLIVLFWAVSALATPVPRETLERLAEINVQIAEIRHLNSIGKLSNEDYTSRAAGIEKERQTLWFPYDRVTSPTTPEERQAAMASIDGLSKIKLSLLEPRWKKEQDALREAGRKREEETATAVEKDAHRAAEFQRQRLLLQRQLDRKEIDRDTFTLKDREAEASIMNLRKKFEDASGTWPQRFDQRLTVLTKVQADTLDAVPTPVSHTRNKDRGLAGRRA